MKFLREVELVGGPRDGEVCEVPPHVDRLSWPITGILGPPHEPEGWYVIEEEREATLFGRPLVSFIGRWLPAPG